MDIHNSADQPIFTYVPEKQQRQTTIQFIEKIIELAGPYSYQHKYAKKIKKLIKPKPPSLAQCLTLAISALDYCLLDEMRLEIGKKYYPWTDKSATYYRYLVYSSWIPPEIMTKLSQVLSIKKINHVLLTHPQQVKHHYNGIGVQGQLTPDLAFWVNSDQPSPPLSLPRQELFLSILKCGMNPLASIDIPVKQITLDTTHQEPSYLRHYRRRASLFAQASMTRVESWKNKTAHHWGTLLGEESTQFRQEAILFNSGTCANEAVLHVLAGLTSGLAYKNLYWYFENIKTYERVFQNRTTSNCKSARIAALNLNPTNFFKWPNISVNVTCTEVIKQMINNAHKHPEKKFYLVLDITVDPLFSLSRKYGVKLPENLIIIKTISVSKHQNGMRNYFFGAVLVVCQDMKYEAELTRLIKKTSAPIGGYLSPGYKVHFPRPSRNRLKQRMKLYALFTNSAARTGEKISGWMVVPYRMHLHILPPKRLGDYFADYIQKSPPCACKIKPQNGQHSLTLNDVLHEVTNDCNNEKIEVGNSFGLSQTRVTIWRGFAIIKKDKYLFDAIRVCPGFDTKITDFDTFISKLLTRLKGIRDEQLLDLLNIESLPNLQCRG